MDAADGLAGNASVAMTGAVAAAIEPDLGTIVKNNSHQSTNRGRDVQIYKCEG